MADGDGGFFNLGTGAGLTVKEIADAVERAYGKPLSRIIGPRRTGDPAVLIASNARAREVLGWSPVHSSVQEIVETAMRWHRKDDMRRGPTV